MANKAQVRYDSEEDILFVYTGEKSHDSLEFDQFTVDFSSDDKIVAVEISGASLFLKDLLDIAVDKERLADVKEAMFSVIQQKEFAYVKIAMKLPIAKGKTIQETIYAPVPMAVIA